MAMEHVVQVMKDHIKVMGQQKTKGVVLKKTGALAGIAQVCEQFSSQTGVIVRASGHSHPSALPDEQLLIDTLRRVKPFQHNPSRVISSMPRLTNSPVCKLKKEDLKTWITAKQLSFMSELGN
ncbi:hypothetical protein BaRGS_00030212 [Batillaria attramentaria]|uniref:Uncharacterized protein n=1 Tax=Batillaria attramentaria TaxID=370345 RepID=A0ABD0JV39_9CAEN